MKKLVINLIFLMSLFIVLVLSFVSGLGIDSGVKYVDFKPGIELNYNFQVFADSNQKIELYSRGEFSDLVKFDKKILDGGGSFNVKIRLPENIEIPGKHTILIGARESSENNDEGNIGTSVAVQVPIIIQVPYPGKYAEVLFNIGNVNFGDNIKFDVEVASMGKEPISAGTSVEIYSNDKKIDDFDLGSKIIENQKKDVFIKIVNSSKYSPGNYKAIAIIDYQNGIAKADSIFRIGKLFVNISNFTQKVIKKGIRPFEISIESLWNDPIENIYGEVYFLKNNQNITNFITPSISLAGWEKKNLLGYVDSEKFEIGEYDSIIKIFYKNNQTIINGKLKVIRESDTYLYAIILLVILVIIFAVAYLFYKRNIKSKNVRKNR